MTLKEFLEGIDNFVKENPEVLDLQVVTSKDDEGNGYNPVYYTPTMGLYEDRDFTPYKKEDKDDYPTTAYIEKDEINAICIN